MNSPFLRIVRLFAIASLICTPEITASGDLSSRLRFNPPSNHQALAPRALSALHSVRLRGPHQTFYAKFALCFLLGYFVRQLPALAFHIPPIQHPTHWSLGLRVLGGTIEGIGVLISIVGIFLSRDVWPDQHAYTEDLFRVQSIFDVSWEFRLSLCAAATAWIIQHWLPMGSALGLAFPAFITGVVLVFIRMAGFPITFEIQRVFYHFIALLGTLYEFAYLFGEILSFPGAHFDPANIFWFWFGAWMTGVLGNLRHAHLDPYWERTSA